MDRTQGIGGTTRFKTGEEHPRWKGGKANHNGIAKINMPDHPRADSNGYVIESIVVAESVLGEPLPLGAVVHHVNHDQSDNRPCNLVICESQAFHVLIHTRERLIAQGINPNMRRCVLCKEYDYPDNMIPNKRNRSFRHQSCHNEYKKMLRRRKNAG